MQLRENTDASKQLHVRDGRQPRLVERGEFQLGTSPDNIPSAEMDLNRTPGSELKSVHETGQ